MMQNDAGFVATTSLPSGASVGKYEAVNVPAAVAVTNTERVVAPAIIGCTTADQADIDARLSALDSTPNRSKLGANSLLGTSLTAVKLAAIERDEPLYSYIQQISGSPGYTLPTPMLNLINGGAHATYNLDFQEFLVTPLGLKTFHEKLSAGRRIFIALGEVLKRRKLSALIGAEGGYAPNLETNEMAISFLVEAVKSAGYTPGKEVFVGIDVAASALPQTFNATVDAYKSLFDNYPLLSIEDPFREDEWDKWSALRRGLEAGQDQRGGWPRLIVGDDLFVTNTERLSEGINRYVANAILIKINQAATFTETIEAINLARKANYVHIISHRSGDTLDSFISDLAVGTAAAFIKAGAANDQAPERIVKYERIMRIEEELEIARTGRHHA